METALEAVLTAGTLAAFGGEANAELSVSSWYGPWFEESTTASGEVYRTDARAAAHSSLPFGTKVLVTYGERRRSWESQIGVLTLTIGAWTSPRRQRKSG